MDGFCTRTGPILFCCFDRNSVYFLDILQHGRAHTTVWVNEDILRVIKDNWPKPLDRYRLKGNHNLSPSLTPEEKLTLRKKHCNRALEIDGSRYLSPGMGLLGTGESVRVFNNTRLITNHMTEVIFRCNADGDFPISENRTLKDVFPKKDRFAQRPAILRLRKNGTGLELFEERTSSILARYDLFVPIF